MIRIPEGSAPDFKKKSWTMAAEVTIPQGGAKGVLATMGGRYGGWALLVKDDGKPQFAYAYSNQPEDKYRVTADQSLAPGNHVLRVKFDYDGGGIGKGGMDTLLVDENRRHRGALKRRLGSLLPRRNLRHRRRHGTPVLEEYEVKMPYQFTGTLKKFAVVLEPSKLSAEELQQLHAELAKAMAAVH